ncbi:MAG: hypothetical protein ACREPR_25035 [Brasilonema sp.]
MKRTPPWLGRALRANAQALSLKSNTSRSFLDPSSPTRQPEIRLAGI